MRLKSTLLYLFGTSMLIFGNRDLFDSILEDRQNEKEAKKKVEDAKKASGEKFEVQNLVFDADSKQWKNPRLYFQVYQVGDVNFSALRKNYQGNTKIEKDDSEQASDSN